MKKRSMAWLMTLLALLSGGCTTTPAVEEATAPAIRGMFSPEQAELPDDTLPCDVLGGVEATERVVSLVLEGFTDDKTMLQLAEGLSARGIYPVLLLTGENASEHADTVRQMAERGFPVGNAGLTLATAADRSTARQLRQLRRAQALLTAATGASPTLFRLGSTSPTDTLLKLGTLCGLTQLLSPSAFLNHRSFDDPAEALSYVRRMPWGTLLCYRLGAELTQAEYGDPIGVLDEKPAIDPSAGIAETTLGPMDVTVRYQADVEAVLWLADALMGEGFTVLTPEMLAQASRLPDLAPLTEAQSDLTDPARYPLPVTAKPLGIPPQAPLQEGQGVLLVGDASLAPVARYVAEVRGVEPDFLSGTVLLAEDTLSCAGLLTRFSDESPHPLLDGEPVTVEDAARQTGSKRIVLMLGQRDIAREGVTRWLVHLRTLTEVLRAACPDAVIVLATLSPLVQPGEANDARFAANLALARMCLQAGYPLIDTAFVLRDEQGCMAAEFADEQGGLLPAGCQAVLNTLTEQ